MLTISQLAQYVGVSTRTVRYYHQRGLLPEPGRTSGGYRTYDADAVIRLTKITTLARSGVPLARIEELLAADPETFREGVADIDRDLEQRIRDLRRDRERLGHLQSGERLCLPTLICEYLDDLREAGVPEPVMVAYRDSWLVTCAMYRDQVDGWIAESGYMIAHPEYVALQARTLKLQDRAAGRPRGRQHRRRLGRVGRRALGGARGEPGHPDERPARQLDRRLALGEHRRLGPDG